MKINTKISKDIKTYKSYIKCIDSRNKGFVNQLLKNIILEQFLVCK